MQAPKGVTLEGFYLGRAKFLCEECTSNAQTGVVLCRHCGGRIKAAAVQVEIHEAANGRCLGNGEGFEAGLPYCPSCEELPANVGCVHA